jgi:dienelactone hydrolase
MRDRLRAALGDWQIRLEPPETVAGKAIPGARLFDLRFAGSHGYEVPATLALPETDGPYPAILWAHAHGGNYELGRRELIQGRPALTRPPVPELTRAGFAVLCLEMPCFGARALPGESSLAKALLWQGRTLFGQMLAELQAGVDLLSGNLQIIPERIGVAGVSMGGTLSFWLAALDPRIRAAAHMCCFADLAFLVAAGAHDSHGIYMTVPGLLPLISTGELAGLVAPRAQLVCVGLADPFTPAGAFALARAELAAAYASAPGQLEILADPASGHAETPAMRQRLLDFFGRHLRPAAN